MFDIKYLAAKPLCFSIEQKMFCLCQALWRAALKVLPGASFDGQIFLSLFLCAIINKKAQICVSSHQASLPKPPSDESHHHGVNVRVCWTL